MLFSQPSTPAAAPPPGMFAGTFLRAEKSASGKNSYHGRTRRRNFYPQPVPAPQENAALYDEHASEEPVVWDRIGEPFGETTKIDGSATLNLRGPGEYFDVETGLIYNFFRTLDPTTNIYTQSDPIGLLGGINPRIHVGQNPVNFIDPLGLMTEEIGQSEECLYEGGCRPTGGGGFAGRGGGGFGSSPEPVANPGGGQCTVTESGITPKPGTRVQPQGVPDNWRIGPSDSPGGVKYSDPKNPGNQVRVEQGDPNSPYPNSQAPYVRDLRNGQYRDAQGNIVPRNDPAGHIPLDQYPGYKP